MEMIQNRDLNSSAPRDEQTSSFFGGFLEICGQCGKLFEEVLFMWSTYIEFLQIFTTQPSDFEKMSITNDVCLLLGADELTLSPPMVILLKRNVLKKLVNNLNPFTFVFI